MHGKAGKVQVGQSYAEIAFTPEIFEVLGIIRQNRYPEFRSRCRDDGIRKMRRASGYGFFPSETSWPYEQCFHAPE